MRIINCDICSREIKASEYEPANEYIDKFIEYFAEIHNPDICLNCISDLKRHVKEAIIRWKLAEGKKL